ncbi:hypothetical protein [Nocardia alni]|uniref:hypothetical protein n=1 Tax=Nocardia alni TaxID=2815723 RepID=UPI001C234521|nr:hypothetical protein [Nocardia alni]
MNGINHPYSKDLYERDEAEDRVKITRQNGEVGYFAADGRWLEGARFEADLHLCGWIMSPRHAHRLAAKPASN